MSGDLEDVKLDSETDIEPEHGGGGQGTEAASSDDGGGRSKPAAAAAAKDHSNYSLVEAAQYGLLQRCHDLIENEGADVTQGDEENITPLHWAAINNRIPVASYFLQKGADINAIGGELKSTPIHWAARQGHLSMVVHLMRYGARPEILDGEGINCLHIAAQFGFNRIMAYLLSCRTPLYIDCLDSQGRTPLMHAATRAAKSFDTTRLLVSLGANVRAMDNKNNTALHYSATNLNYPATKVLLDSNAPVDVKNNDDKTPYDLAIENKNMYDAELILLARQKTSPRGLKEYLTRSPRFCWWMLFLFPIFLLFVIGWIGLVIPNWWTYMLTITALGWVVRFWLTTYLPVHPDNPPVAFGLVIGTKLLIYVTAIYYGIPTGVIVHWVWLHILLVVTLTVFYRTTLSDPGHIPKTTNPEQARRAIADLCERGLFVETNYCATCLVRRPLRSKHCAACDRCVARFDHHCPWVNNCIGVRNHKIFLFYLVCLLFMLTWGAKASVTFVYRFHLATHGNFVVRMYHYITAQPWIGYIMITCFIHLTWVYLLLLAQIFQMVCQGVTTNEMRNRHRYEHFQKFDGANPFHRGIIANCLDLFGFTCCQDRASQVDWTKTYDIPKSFNSAVKKAEEEERVHQSTIPLPFSSTWNPSKDKPSRAKRFSRGRRANGYLSSDDDGGIPQQQQFTAHQEYQI